MSPSLRKPELPTFISPCPKYSGGTPSDVEKVEWVT
jgi:hypothetical protein